MGTGWQCKGVWAEFQVAAVGNSEGGISSNDLGQGRLQGHGA